MARKARWMRYRYQWMFGVFTLVCGCFPGMKIDLGGESSAKAGIQANSGSQGGTVNLRINPKTGEVEVEAGGGAAAQRADAEARAAAAIEASAKKADTTQLMLIVLAGVGGLVYLLHLVGPKLLMLLK